jgi:hypothetical protein
MGHEVYHGSGHGPYVQQVCARGAVLQGIVVLIVGGYKSPSPCEVNQASANIVSESRWVSGCVCVHPPTVRGVPPPFIDQGEIVTIVPHGFRCGVAVWRTVLAI